MIQLLDRCLRGNKIVPLWHSCLVFLEPKVCNFIALLALIQQFPISNFRALCIPEPLQWAILKLEKSAEFFEMMVSNYRLRLWALTHTLSKVSFSK